MENNKGFIELNNVLDYWDKLNYDYSNLITNNENVYDAFNFFVTAWHFTDWYFNELFPSDSEKELKGKIRNFKTDNPIIKVCEHIANGGKHFSINLERHNSVKKIEKLRYFEKGYCEDDYSESPILIQLDNELREKLGEFIFVKDFADCIIKFWKNELIKNKLI